MLYVNLIVEDRASTINMYPIKISFLMKFYATKIFALQISFLFESCFLSLYNLMIWFYIIKQRKLLLNRTEIASSKLETV